MSPAIGVNGLSIDVASARAAQESHGFRYVFRLAALAGNGLVGQVMRGFRLALGAWCSDRAGTTQFTVMSSEASHRQGHG